MTPSLIVTCVGVLSVLVGLAISLVSSYHEARRAHVKIVYRVGLRRLTFALDTRPDEIDARVTRANY